MHPRWQRHPRPEPEVVRLLEQALEAARRGQVRALLIVTVNPLHETENASGGDLGLVGRNVLLGELAQVQHRLLGTPPKE